MPKVVVDTNKIISALLRESTVRRILFNPRLIVLLPEYVLDEINEHRERLLESVPEEALNLLLTKLIERAHVVSMKDVDDEIRERAIRIAENFDIDDYLFIAVAIKYNAIIWTNDKKLIRHGLTSGEYIAVDTWGLRRLLSGEELATVLEKLRRKYLATG